jgi:aminoglycoside N3'-acetyltransferase
MGYVEGGPKTVIDGVLDAVGEKGTAAIATLWWDGGEEKTPELFDRKNSPAYNGAIAEAMRQDDRSLRSSHYSHSVSAIGAEAEYLTSEHGTGRLYPDPWNETAFSEKSPWTKLYEKDALYAFIGCTMNVCTMKHWIEGHFIAEYLDKLPENVNEEGAGTCFFHGTLLFLESRTLLVDVLYHGRLYVRNNIAANGYTAGSAGCASVKR